MSQWTTLIQSSGILTQRDNVRRSLEQAQEIGASEVSANDALGRLQAMFDHISGMIDRLDPLLVPTSSVTNATQQLAAMNGQIATFVSNKNVGHLHNAIEQMDNALINLMRAPLLRAGRGGDVPSSVKSYAETVDRYREEAEKQLNVARATVASLSNRASEIELVVDNIKAESSRLLTTQQEAFNAAQERHSTAHTTAQAERAATFAAVQTAWNEEADGVVAKFLESGATAIQSFQSDSDDATKKAKASWDAAETGLRNNAQSVISDMETLKAEADKIVGIIGERGVTSNYQRVADAAHSEMIFWHFVVVVTLGGLIYAAVFEFLPALTGEWSWGAFAGRLIVSVAVLALASYAGLEAKHARQVSRRNREREMHLAALGPYLTPLPPEMQQQFRMKYGEQAFSPADAQGLDVDGDRKGMAISPNANKALEALVSLVAERLGK